MNLLSAIVEHQNSLLRLYRKLEERFEENSIIQTLWRDMSGDVLLQIQSLKSLPSSFWNKFKNDPDNNFEPAIKEIPSASVDVTDISLRDSFEISLQIAEPVVLKIYARVVRLLREQSTAPALNFYILIKTYVARLVRTTESFSGDPLLIRRARLLVAELEKEVQEPTPKIKVLASMALAAKKQKKPVLDKANLPKLAKADLSKTDKPAKETMKVPPKSSKTAAPKPVKTVPVKPAKAASVKTKAFFGKKTATTKRA